MLKRNIKEYEMLRADVNSLKNCITTYFGYLMAGSGIALLGLASLSNSATKDVTLTPIVAILLSLGVSFFLYILFYKFNSHNRSCGYCKLLLHERNNSGIENTTNADENSPIKNNDDVIAWEFCITRLRESDNNIEKIIESIENEKIASPVKEDLIRRLKFIAGPKPNCDEGNVNKGISLLFSTLKGNTIKTNSWAFPSHIILIYFLITTLFFVFGCGITLHYWLEGREADYISVLLIIIVGAFIQRHMWRGFFGKYFSLMAGSATVDAFCWKFIPSRIEYLNNDDIHPNYKLIDSSLGETGFGPYVYQELFEKIGAKGFVLDTLHLIFGNQKIMKYLSIPKNDDRKYIKCDNSA